MSNSTVHNLIIIGSGPAGLTAGIYASRANLKPMIIEGKNVGGQLMGTTLVENWPGNISILGPNLMINMRQHAQHFGSTFISEEVVRVNFKERPFSVITNKNKEFKAHSIIIATGATPKRLGCPGEDLYWAKGVSTCAVCDGAFYKDKSVIVVGGGDTAMEDASFLTNFTDKITIVHIQDQLTASAAMQQRVLNNPKITILYNSTVTEIKGDKNHVTHALITNQITKETTDMASDAVFVAIGLNPNTQIFKNQVVLTKNGYLQLENNTHTSVPGVFGAGDVADYKYRQAITSAGIGCMAALDAERYLKEL